MALLVVVRHGETSWNREGRLQGQKDIALNEVGRDQASAVAEKLQDEFGSRPPPIYTSDLARARETARIVGRALGVRPRLEPALRERGFGASEGKDWAELARVHPDEVRAYRRREDPDALPGSEPIAAFRARVLDAVRAIAARRPRAILVTHGGVLRVLLEEAMGADRLFIIANTAVYHFEVEGERIERVISSAGEGR